MNNRTDCPLLSVVIPTRNRLHFAISAIENVLNIKDLRLELVVQDNSDINSLELWLKNNISDSRLLYNYIEKPLSFIDNFNAAIEITTGKYICIIGDDDGVIPEIVEAAEYLYLKSIDCLSIRTVTNFVWPNSGVPSTLFTKTTGGYLTIEDFKGSIEYVDVFSELNKFITNGATNYLNFNLPKLYHGIVRRECLITVKKITGNFFGGLSPDIYMSIALACTVKKVAMTNYPLTMPGVCHVSASIVEGLLKRNSKKLEHAPHLRNRGFYNWSDIIPQIYCVETIWADSCIAALRDLGREDLVQQINLPKLAAHCISSNSGIAKEVFRHLPVGLALTHKNRWFGLFKLFGYLLMLIFKFSYGIINRVYQRMKIIIGIPEVIRIDNLENINDSSTALLNYLSKKKCSFKDIVKQGDFINMSKNNYLNT